MNRQDTSRHHPCRTLACLADFCSPVLHFVFHCILSPPLLPTILKPLQSVCRASRRSPADSLARQRCRSHWRHCISTLVCATCAGHRCRKDRSDTGWLLHIRSLYTCTDPSATRGNNNSPSAPTSAQSRRTHFPFSRRHCMALCMPYSKVVHCTPSTKMLRTLQTPNSLLHVAPRVDHVE
jgi:hypothetical protein